MGSTLLKALDLYAIMIAVLTPLNRNTASRYLFLLGNEQPDLVSGICILRNMNMV